VSEFADWFVAQHGKRYSGGLQRYSDQQLRDMIEDGRTAERVLSERELWDKKRMSALYAWTAREQGTKL
jgi:hypothetical protein